MATLKTLEITKEIYLRDLSFLDTQILRGLTGIKKDNTLFALANSLIRKGILKRLEKGKYLVVGKSVDDFALAHFLYHPSYVSLESALNLFGLLSQFPYEITSVTPLRKREKRIEGKVFIYFHINPRLYWGLEKKKEMLIALPEKALLDSIYFASKGIRKIDFEDLDLTKINKERLEDFIKRYPKTKQFLSVYQILKRRL